MINFQNLHRQALIQWSRYPQLCNKHTWLILNFCFFNYCKPKSLIKHLWNNPELDLGSFYFKMHKCQVKKKMQLISRVFALIIHVAVPDSRFSRALLQNISQALLVESFTCSLKDLRSGVFTVCAISMWCSENRSTLFPYSICRETRVRLDNWLEQEEESFHPWCKKVCM